VRVNYRGLNASRVRESKEVAKDAESTLRESLRRKVEHTEQTGLQPATVKALFEHYVADLAARGKGPDTVGRAAQTATAFEAVLPALLAAPVGQFKEKDVFAFREARTRAGTKPSTVNRDLRTIRAMLKRARPDFRFPAGAFFPEDETRVRWLRPDEEILVLEPMPSPFREIAKVAALTLMRQGEIRLLRREMVHLEQGVILLPRAKGGARPVILNEAARKILLSQLEAHDKACFFPSPEGVPYSRVHVSRVFRKAARGGRTQGLPLPRPASPRGYDGAQRRVHRADRDAARRVEDGEDDAAVCGCYGYHAAGGCRGGEWGAAGAGTRETAGTR
jgi:integrase